jgi:DNA-binding MarR family transcriptional regulator
MSRETKSDLMMELGDANRANQVAVDKMDEAGGRALGINRTDSRCIDIVHRAGRISAGRLAEEAGLTSGALTAVVDRLERKGYLRRVPDPEDRRRVLVEVTELLERRAMELWGVMAERGTPLLARFSTAELQAVLRFLRLSTELNERRAAEIRAGLDRPEAGS